MSPKNRKSTGSDPSVQTRLQAAQDERDKALEELRQLKASLGQGAEDSASNASTSVVNSPVDPSVAAVIQALTDQQQKLVEQFAKLLPSNPNGDPLSQPQSPSVGMASSNTTHSAAARRMEIPKLVGPECVQIATFKDWKQRWQDYATAQRVVEDCSIATQHGIIRSALDSEWTILWNAGCLGIQPDSTIEFILDQLEKYLRQKRNPLLDRQDFHRRDQMSGESVDKYFAALKTIDETCAYEDLMVCIECNQQFVPVCDKCSKPSGLQTTLQNIRLRDRLICGLRDKEMQKKVLSERYSSELTLDKVRSICCAVEHSNQTGDLLGAGKVSQVCATTKKSSYKKQKNPAHNTKKSQASHCGNCGGPAHPKSTCKAKDVSCRKCGRLGHYQKMCRQSSNQQPQQRQSEESSQGEKKGVGYLSVNCASTNKELLLIETNINDTQRSFPIKWLPDTGADVDAIGIHHIREFKIPENFSPDVDDVRAANGGRLGSIGTLRAILCYNGKRYETKLHVFKNVTVPLLSRSGCKSLGLIAPDWPLCTIGSTVSVKSLSTNSSNAKTIIPQPTTHSNLDSVKKALIEKCPQAFNDTTLRPMDGPPMRIELIEGAQPCKRFKAHTIPYHWRDEVEKQLQGMVSKDIIEPVPVGEAIEWCHPMVVVPKKGSNEPRITVDLTGLNKFVRRPAYPTKIPREVVARIPPGCKYFTTLDARHGYWQVLLDEASSKLTTFITPWGCYRFKRNVMGLISAGDEHNRRGDEALKGIDQVEKLVEDIIIFDEDLEKHIERVQQVIQRCEKFGITLNLKKFVFAQPVVDWCGYRISNSGYSVTPTLVSALKKFPTPTNKTDVRSFCGLVQQFETFSPCISELAIPLRSLLSAKSEFVWTEAHQTAFGKLIEELSSPRVLAQFVPGQPIRLETDAAQSKGLGYALWQQQSNGTWRLLRCGSRFVTPTEARYSASEVEMLACVWAIKKCRLFLLGHPFELIVDHRPLIPIINSKTLDEIENPRLQRLKEKLASYRVTAVWREGKKHIVVDCFSRFPVEDPDNEDLEGEHEVEQHLYAIRSAAMSDGEGTPIVEDSTLRAICEAGQLSSEHRRLKALIQHGFPKDNLGMDEDIRPYWGIRDELTCDGDIILFGSRIVVPKTMRKTVLQTLHSSHQGQERTLRRARQSVYWPGFNNEVRNMIKGCSACAERLPSQTKEPMFRDPPPTRPFESVSTDLFSYAGYEYLVMVDKFSGWINVAKCGRTAGTSQVIHHLKSWFTDLGIPVKLTSDGGPQFSSMEFKNWCSKWGIQHNPSSPHYPQANGLAESAVKAAKSLIAKTSPNGNLDTEEFQFGLMELRNTPRATGASPSQLLFGIPIRTKLPLHFHSFVKEWKSKAMDIDARAEKLREKAASQYNSTSHPLRKLTVGDVVRIQDPKTRLWTTIGEVIGIDKRGRSYTLKTESGRTYWRNRRFLRPFMPDEDREIEEKVETSVQQPRRSTRARRPPIRYQNKLNRTKAPISREGM